MAEWSKLVALIFLKSNGHVSGIDSSNSDVVVGKFLKGSYWAAVVVEGNLGEEPSMTLRLTLVDTIQKAMVKYF